MERLAGVIVRWLIRQEAISKNDSELYAYAVHCFFLGIAPFIYAVVIGGIMGELKVSITLIIPFMVIRKLSGGFHTKKEWVCLMSSCLLLCVSIYTASSILHCVLYDSIVLLAVIELIVFSPIDSENRRLEKWEKKLRKREVAMLSLLFYGIYLGLLFLMKERMAISIGMGLILTAGLQMPCVWEELTKKIKKLSFRDKTVEK